MARKEMQVLNHDEAQQLLRTLAGDRLEALCVLAITTVLWSWNELLWPLVVSTSCWTCWRTPGRCAARLILEPRYRFVPTFPNVMLGPKRNDQWLAMRGGDALGSMGKSLRSS